MHSTDCNDSSGSTVGGFRLAIALPRIPGDTFWRNGVLKEERALFLSLCLAACSSPFPTIAPRDSALGSDPNATRTHARRETSLQICLSNVGHRPLAGSLHLSRPAYDAPPGSHSSHHCQKLTHHAGWSFLVQEP